MVVRGEKLVRQFIRNGRGTNIFEAVKETDIVLEPGKLLLLGGRSGGGKSTLMNMLAGLLAPTSGKVLVDDTDLYTLDDEKLSQFRSAHFGYIPQGQSGIHSLTVLENVLLPCTLYGEQETETEREYALSLLERMEIAGISDVYPSELSGGEMRRMAVARALVKHPDFIFADEPTGDLDDENTETVFSLLRQAADDGAAVLVVTHENEYGAFADQSLRMDAGVLYAGRG